MYNMFSLKRVVVRGRVGQKEDLSATERLSDIHMITTKYILAVPFICIFYLSDRYRIATDVHDRSAHLPDPSRRIINEDIGIQYGFRRVRADI